MENFWEKMRKLSEPQTPLVPPAEMAAHLRTLTDQQWGQYAFSREPLEGKFTSQQKDSYTAAANTCGAMWADTIAARYGISDPVALCQAMGLRVEYPTTPVGGGQVLFAQFVQPDEITIFTDCLDKAQSLGGLLPQRETLQRILLAHELFHAVEERNPTIYTRTEKVELWRKPFSNKSRIVCLSEIAAMAFARRLLRLDFYPYLLDVLMTYPYDVSAACGLYAEICDLLQEE